MGLVIIFSQVHNINRDTHTVEERSIANEDLMEYVRLLMKDIIENKNYKHYKPIRETTEINVVVKKYIENEKVDDETKTNIAEKYLEAEVTAQELVKKLGVEIKRGYLVEALMKDEEKYYYIISKSEIDSYLDDETTKRRTGLPYKDKTLKSALYIYNAEKERESILISDKSNSEYWVKQFLEVEQENKDDVSTTKIFSMIDAVIKRETIGSSDKGARSRVDYYNLRNYLIMYFKQPRQFVYDEMMAYIFEEYVPEHPQVVNMTRLKAAVYNKVNEFTSVLNHLQLVLCIACLSNYTEIKEYSVRYDMRGYKLVDGEYCIRDAKDVSQTSGVLYKIVQWVYVDDFNVIDKCNIVRNILSLYIRKSWLEIGQEAYTAIISGYKVYLKSSVDNYLQIKNEVVDKITDISEKIVLVAESISTRVRNNLLALASFFITTLVVNTISTEKIENIFTKDITVLSYVFMIISFGYLLLCNWEMKKQKEKIQKIYESSKQLYQDVLCEEDIRNIYCGDTIYNEGIKLADDMMKKYNIFWIVSMGVVGIGIWILYMAQLQ